MNRARTRSARLREEVKITRTELEKERQNHKKTLKECEELKSMNKMLMTKGEDDKKLMESRLQQLKTTIEELEKQVYTCFSSYWLKEVKKKFISRRPSAYGVCVTS